MSKLYPIKHHRDSSEMLNIIIAPDDDKETWVVVGHDFTKNLGAGLMKRIVTAGKDELIECVLLAREEYDELVDLIEAGDGCD